MIRYEWKKLFQSRLNLAAMLSGYLLIGVCLFFWIRNYSVYDEKTDSYRSGIEGFHLSQQRAMGQTDLITEEYVTKLLAKIQSCGLEQDSDEAYVKIARPLGDIYYFLAKHYTPLGKRIDRTELDRVDLTDGARFYERRMDKITDYLNMDFSFGNYTEAEKSYWIHKAEAVTVPFAWGDQTVMDCTWDIIMLGFYLLFVIIICVSSVFSSEHESGAAALLLTTKYGKDRLVLAKMTVSVLFTLGYLIISSLAGVGVMALLFGLPGRELPVQLWDTAIPYDLTVWQACLWSFAVMLLIGLTVMAVQLCCSAVSHSSFTTLVLGVLLMIGPAFLPMSKTSGLWNHINYLFPVRAFNVKDTLSSYMSYAFGDLVISLIGMTLIVYAAVGVAALLLTRRGFVKMK